MSSWSDAYRLFRIPGLCRKPDRSAMLERELDDALGVLRGPRMSCPDMTSSVLSRVCEKRALTDCRGVRRRAMIRAASIAAMVGVVSFVAVVVWQSPLRPRPAAPLSRVVQTASLDGSEQWRAATARLIANRARVTGEPGAMPEMLAGAMEPLGQYLGVTLPAPSDDIRRAMRQPLSALATSVSPASGMPSVVRAVASPAAGIERLLSRVQTGATGSRVMPTIDESLSIDSSGFVSPR